VPALHENYFELARDFFGEIAKSAQKHDVMFLIEPNSQRFDCNFLNSAQEAAEFVSKVSESGLGVNLDLGAEFDAGSDLDFSMQEIGTFGHAHLSEPDLGPLSTNPLIQKIASDVELLNHFEYLTIEQLGSAESSNLASVSRSLSYARGVLKA
jgi:sugar phosphate isomerase/epimerase